MLPAFRGPIRLGGLGSSMRDLRQATPVSSYTAATGYPASWNPFGAKAARLVATIQFFILFPLFDFFFMREKQASLSLYGARIPFSLTAHWGT